MLLQRGTLAQATEWGGSPLLFLSSRQHPGSQQVSQSVSHLAVQSASSQPVIQSGYRIVNRSHGYQSASHPGNLVVSQPSAQPFILLPASQPFSHPVSNQSVSQSVSHPGTQSESHSIQSSSVKSVSQPASLPDCYVRHPV